METTTQTVLQYFLEGKNEFGLPSQIRTDHSEENILVKRYMNESYTSIYYDQITCWDTTSIIDIKQIYIYDWLFIGLAISTKCGKNILIKIWEKKWFCV